MSSDPGAAGLSTPPTAEPGTGGGRTDMVGVLGDSKRTGCWRRTRGQRLGELGT